MMRLVKAATVCCCAREAGMLPPEALWHGDQKPFVKQEVTPERETDTHRQDQGPAVPTNPSHVKRQVEGGGWVEANAFREGDHGDGWYGDRQQRAPPAWRHEWLVQRWRGMPDRLPEDHEATEAQPDRQPEGKKPTLWAIDAPANVQGQ